MRDNVKSGALTEVTFYILLSLYSPKHGYAVMQFIEEKTGGRLSLGGPGPWSLAAPGRCARWAPSIFPVTSGRHLPRRQKADAAQ